MPNDGQWYGVDPKSKKAPQPEPQPVFVDTQEPDNLNLPLDGDIQGITAEIRTFPPRPAEGPWQYFWMIVTAIITANLIMGLMNLIAGWITYSIFIEALKRAIGK